MHDEEIMQFVHERSLWTRVDARILYVGQRPRRPAVVLGPSATEGQRGSVKARHEDVVKVVDANAVPTATGR